MYSDLFEGVAQVICSERSHPLEEAICGQKGVREIKVECVKVETDADTGETTTTVASSADAQTLCGSKKGIDTRIVEIDAL